MRRSAPALCAGVAAALAPLFLLPVALLVLDRLALLDLPYRVAYRRLIIGNLLLYWAVATVLLAAVIRRRELAHWVRSRRPQLVLMLVAFCLTLSGAEILLRVLDPPIPPGPFVTVPSRELHHVNPASSRGRGAGGVLIETNADGFRTGYGRREFLAHPIRVVVLGDSFAFGWGVPAEKTCSAVLERELRHRLSSEEVAVLNAGVASYSPFIERALFHRIVREYRPTLTLLLLDLTDIGDDLVYTERNVSSDPLNPRFDVPERWHGPSFADRLALWRASAPLRWRLGIPYEVLRGALSRDLRDYYSFRVSIGGIEEDNRFFVLRHPLELTREHFERTLLALRALAHEVHQAGSGFVLVVTPRYFHWSDVESPHNWEAQEFGYYRVDEAHELEYFRFFEQRRAVLDFPVLSLLPVFRNTAEFPLVFDHDPHWNTAGHRLVGQALADYVLANGHLGAPGHRRAEVE